MIKLQKRDIGCWRNNSSCGLTEEERYVEFENEADLLEYVRTKLSDFNREVVIADDTLFYLKDDGEIFKSPLGWILSKDE